LFPGLLLLLFQWIS